MSQFRLDDYMLGGGDLDRVSVSVRVCGDDLDPHEVTQLLGVQPTFAAKKGERRQSGGREIAQPTGVWSIEFSGAPEEWALDDAIEALFGNLPQDPAVWEHLSDRWSLDLFCAVHLSDINRGVAIRRDLLRRIADRQLDLDLDIYCIGPV